MPIAQGNIAVPSLILVVFLSLAPPANADYTVDCEGHNNETVAYVYGECSNGEFEGYDHETGSYVYGECQPGESLDAYDLEADQYVYIECEDLQPESGPLVEQSEQAPLGDAGTAR